MSKLHLMEGPLRLETGRWSLSKRVINSRSVIFTRQHLRWVAQMKVRPASGTRMALTSLLATFVILRATRLRCSPMIRTNRTETDRMRSGMVELPKDGLGSSRAVRHRIAKVGRHRSVAAPPGEPNLPSHINSIASTQTDESAASLSQRPMVIHRRFMWKSHAENAPSAARRRPHRVRARPFQTVGRRKPFASDPYDYGGQSGGLSERPTYAFQARGRDKARAGCC